MATYSVNTGEHATLTAATVDIVNLGVRGRYVQVVHRGSATNPIYFTLGATAATPAVAGDNTYVSTPSLPTVLAWPLDANASAQVRLISAGAEPYSVQVLSDRLG